MATNTAGGVGQAYHTDQVHYIAETVDYTTDDTVVTFKKKLPAGAVVIEAGAVVTTAFTAGSAVLDIGTVADPNAFGTALVLTATGRIIDTAVNANDDYSASADVPITASVTSDDTLTAGSAVVYVMYIIPDR